MVYLLFAIRYSLFAIRYSLFAIRYSLFTIHYSLFTIPLPSQIPPQRLLSFDRFEECFEVAFAE